MLSEILFEKIDHERSRRNYLSLEQTLNITQKGNILTDPFSVLISKNVIIGSNNIFYPNVIIELNLISSFIKIGNNNVFYPQSFLLAENGGSILIEDSNHFEGGVSIKANVLDSNITIGSFGRFLNGVQIIGRCNLGSGSQIIGNITVQNCNLEAGESFLCDNPDLRGGLIKGYGLVRNLTIGKGKVIDGAGTFDSINIQDQSFYHPKKK